MIAATIVLASTLGALHVSPCTIGATRVAASCGTFSVFEDRVAQAGRTIALHFILLKAKHPSRHVIAFNPGGPGGSSTADAAVIAEGGFAAELSSLRDRYDVLFLDNRGTGESAPLNCEFTPVDRPDEYFASGLPDVAVDACRERLASRANLSLYSTTAAIGDLDDLRAALGYRKIALDGASYGTRLYLAYARAYPDHVESLVLRGVVPPHFIILPLEIARGFESSINKLFAECKADSGCSRRYPDFEQHFKAVAARLNGGPLTVPLWDDVAQRTREVNLSKDVFYGRLLEVLYDPNVAAYLPIIIEHAYHNDYMPLGFLIEEITQEGASSGAHGLNLSVVCAEDVPFLTESAIASSSAGTLQGDSRVRALQHSCRIWNVHAASAAFVEPVRSQVPILMIDGTDDPVTPPSYAREALPYLPNARLMIVRGGSHESDSPCIDALADKFVRKGSAAGLNLSACASTYKRPAFASSLQCYQVGTAEVGDAKARFKNLLLELARGRFDRSQLTLALSKKYSAKDVGVVADQLAGAGTLYGFEPLSEQTTKAGKVYKFIARYREGFVMATFAVNSSNRISDLDLE